MHVQKFTAPGPVAQFSVPLGAQVVHVQTRPTEITLWFAMPDAGKKPKDTVRWFQVVPTGQPLVKAASTAYCGRSHGQKSFFVFELHNPDDAELNAALKAQAETAAKLKKAASAMSDEDDEDDEDEDEDA